MLIKPNSEPGAAPAHVPGDLVFAVDFYDDPDLVQNLHVALMQLHAGPRLFWNTFSPRFGQGAWVVSRAEDIREVLAHPDVYSSKDIMAHQALTGASWSLIPAELDGHEHRIFRALVAPFFTPAHVATMVQFIQDRTEELITPILDGEACDFMEAFARPLPIAVSLRMLGLPFDDIQLFVKWGTALLHSLDISERTNAARSIIAYLEDAVEQRRRSPRDDVITAVVNAEVDARPINPDEVRGVLFLLFIGGLDSVVNALGFQFSHLAQTPELQDRLRANPDQTDKAIEEMLRRFSPVSLRRRAVADTELAGVSIKAGDWLTLLYQAGSIDPNEYDDPLTVDIDRKGARHLAFASGPHFCVGAQLARRELKIAMTEWLRRAPPFHLTPGKTPVFHAGTAFGVDYLPLSWR